MGLLESVTGLWKRMIHAKYIVRCPECGHTEYRNIPGVVCPSCHDAEMEDVECEDDTE